MNRRNDRTGDTSGHVPTQKRNSLRNVLDIDSRRLAQRSVERVVLDRPHGTPSHAPSDASSRIGR